MFGNEFLQNHGIVPLPPQDLNGAITYSAWIDMAMYGHVTFVFMTGESADDAAITLQEAKDTAGTGSQTLAYTKYFSNGQRLYFTGRSAANFSVAETITQTGGSVNTAYVYAISSDYLLVIPLTNGTTWTTGAKITGGTSGATAYMNGTGQDEDIMLDRTCSSTFTYPSVTFKTYGIEVDASSLTVADGYKCFRVAVANPGGASIGGGLIILSQPRDRGVPMPSSMGTQKVAATY